MCVLHKQAMQDISTQHRLTVMCVWAIQQQNCKYSDKLELPLVAWKHFSTVSPSSTLKDGTLVLGSNRNPNITLCVWLCQPVTEHIISVSSNQCLPWGH